MNIESLAVISHPTVNLQPLVKRLFLQAIAMLNITPIRAFDDNYIWLIKVPNQPQVIAVDPGDATVVKTYLNANQLGLAAILITHHHDDHIGGVAELTIGRNIPVYGVESVTLPCVTHTLRNDDVFMIAGLNIRMISTPGHTVDHVIYLLDDQPRHLFSGDLLFSAGCGRAFEGTPAQIYQALTKIKHLPVDTLLYPAHEYTLENVGFAKVVEPENSALVDYEQNCIAALAQGLPTLPTSLDTERRINPFLRTECQSVQTAAMKHANRPLVQEVDIFTQLRYWKDSF